METEISSEKKKFPPQKLLIMRIPLFSHYFVMIYRSTQCCDVYVSGIDESITPEVLLRVCDKFANSKSQIIEFSDGLNSLKAVVRFQTAAIANVFINKCNYLKIDDKCTLKAHKLCYEGSDKIAEKGICVKFIKGMKREEINERTIFNTLKIFGEVVKVTLIKSKFDGQLRFALATFGDIESAKFALYIHEYMGFIFEPKQKLQNVEALSEKETKISITKPPQEKISISS